MSFRSLTDEVKKGLPQPGYLLVSSDYFLHLEALSLVKNLVPPGEREFNFHSFDLLSSEGDKLPFEQILDVLNTASFFNGRKFVIIENIQKLLKKDMLKLEAYLLNPSAGSTVILLNSGALKKELKEKLKAAKQIVLDIREREIPSWLQERARMKGFDLSEGAALYLLGIVGPDLGMLSSEIDKLMLAGHSKIEKSNINDIVEGKRTYSAFALIDAIKARDAEKAFMIYSVLKETEEPYSLLGALNWQYAQISGSGKTSGDRKYHYEIFDLLHKADLGIKSSSHYPLELLLVKLLNLSKN
jgi:DNA polymerase III subunit delta